MVSRWYQEYLLYGNKLKEIRNVLPDYEILPLESCHHIPGHIKNVYTELPHLNKNEKEIYSMLLTHHLLKKIPKEVLIIVKV